MLSHVEELENMVQKLKFQLEKKTTLRALPLNKDDSRDRLIDILFKRSSFTYSIVLAQDFSCQLYKEKNFSIDLKLVDSESNFIRNCTKWLNTGNPIPITLKIYTSDLNNPSPI